MLKRSETKTSEGLIFILENEENRKIGKNTFAVSFAYIFLSLSLHAMRIGFPILFIIYVKM